MSGIVLVVLGAVGTLWQAVRVPAVIALLVLYALHGLGSGSIAAELAPGKIIRYEVPNPQSLTYGGGAVWVSGGVRSGQEEIYRIDMATGATTGLPETRGAQWLTFGEGYAWATCGGGGADSSCTRSIVMKIDATSGKVLAQIPLSSQPNDIVTGVGAVWVATDLGVVRIDPTSARVTASFSAMKLPDSVGVGGGKVWVASINHPGLLGLDPVSGAVLARVHVPPPCLLEVSDLGVFLQPCRSTSPVLERVDPVSGNVTYSELFPKGFDGQMTLYGGDLWIGGWAGNHAQVIPLYALTGRVDGNVVRLPESSDPFITIGALGDSGLFLAGGANSLWITHVDANDVIRVGSGRSQG